MLTRTLLAAFLVLAYAHEASAQNTTKQLPMTPVEKSLQEFISWRIIISKCRNDYDSSGAYRVALSTIQGATEACGWLDGRVTKNTSTCRDKVKVAKEKAGSLIEILKTKIANPKSTDLAGDQIKSACQDAVTQTSQEVTGGASAVSNPSNELRSSPRKMSTPATTGQRTARILSLGGHRGRTNTK